MRLRLSRLRRRTAVLFLLLVAVIGSSANMCEYAPVTNDAMVCIYDGSPEGGNRLVNQLPPNSKPVELGAYEYAVTIPANNRFWYATRDANVRDPLAPEFYAIDARGPVPMELEGQARFRFNLERACEWFSTHGKRNANGSNDEGYDLMFNARGEEAARSPWIAYLAENMTPAVREGAERHANAFTPAQLRYDYPLNGNPDDGTLTDGAAPTEFTHDAYGRLIGQGISRKLASDLGGEFFCGIDPTQKEIEEQDPCPDINFDVENVLPRDKDFFAAREAAADTREQLTHATAQAESEKALTAATVASEAARQERLRAQAESARLQAEIDNARCLVFARAGLDCEGKRPAGGNITVQQ